MSIDNNRYRFVLIGRETLLIKCADILLNRGHEIGLIISADNQINRWASAKGIPFFYNLQDAQNTLKKYPFDVLLSIINDIVLPDETLNLAKVQAINYHDGPLPRYAGVNVTSWAIMNGEKQHGITWHKMTSGIDAGDIYKQAFFDISPNETALSLNLKSYEAAATSFSDLIDDLEQKSLVGYSQKLQDRSYYARFLRPHFGGVISWDQPAEQISRMARALDFGNNYINPLGLPKWPLSEKMLVLGDLKVLDVCSSAPPGTVIKAADDTLQVATKDFDVLLSKINTLDGAFLNSQCLFNNYGIQKGVVLKGPDKKALHKITDLNNKFCKKEKFWLKKLEKFQPISFPLITRNKKHYEKPKFKIFNGKLPKNWQNIVSEANINTDASSLILAIYLLYLSRVSSQSYFHIAYSNQDIHQKIFDVSFFFSSYVPLEIDIDHRESVRKAIERLISKFKDVETHETYGLDIFKRFPMLNSKKRDLFYSGFAIESGSSTKNININESYPIKLITTHNKNEYQLVYNSSFLNRRNIAKDVERFSFYIKEVFKNFDISCCNVSLLTATQERKILYDYNSTEADYPKNKTIQRLFEDQVRKTPGSTALIFGDEKLTYKELNSKANQLAYYLRKKGIKSDTLVGIAVERSLEMIIGILGILKAGGAYAPIDPTYPKERVQFMLEDTQTPILLTQKHLSEKLPQNTKAHWIFLDTDWKQISKESEENPIIEVKPDHLAYINYTSGSTGEPKAVNVRHQSVIRLVFGNDYAEFDRRKIFLYMSTLSFDASTFEIWGSLLHGAKCVLATSKVLSVQEIGEIIQKYGINTAWITASLFNVIIDQEPKALSPLKQLLIGGEALSLTHVRKAYENLSFTQIINGYGPTESTTFTCCYQIPKDIEENVTSIPIGKPIGNTTVYILNSNLEPVPIGVPGELHIGGDGLARGYLNRPDLTAEKFIPNPFSAEEGQRLYKTGDLARYLPDGNIEFLGRIDHQVKIRGFRVECGEIESDLRSHPAIQESVVIAKEDKERGEKYLIAYLASKAQDKKPTVTDLRNYLQTKLPDYMMPAYFMFLEKLPLTATGKIDRKEFPEPDILRPEHGKEYIPPKTSEEEVLCEIFQEVLKIERIGIDDNFFDLGGHSLLASQVVNRVQSALSIEMPLQALFEYPTICELSQKIKELKQKTKTSFYSIAKAPEQDKYPLSFAQERLWFLNQLEPDNPFYSIPYIQRLKGDLDRKVFRKALDIIIKRHSSLRTNFRSENGDPYQTISKKRKADVSFIDLRPIPENKREDEVHLLVEEEILKPFNLETGSLIRAKLFKLANQEHVFLLNMHHIISDGWSMGIFWNEFSLVYNAFLNGKENPLSFLKFQYVDYALSQRSQLEKGVFAEQEKYWRVILKGELPYLDLPTDKPRPKIQTYRGAMKMFQIEKALLVGLKHLSKKESCTLFMSVLTAFYIFLNYYSNQKDIIVGSPIANRSHKDAEDIIGFFANTLALRADLSGNPSYLELLQKVKKIAIDAYNNQDYPFERLVEVINPARDTSRNPIFQAALAFQNATVAQPKLERINIETFETDYRSAKFDITTFFWEENQQLFIAFEYNTDLFKASTIEKMTEYFETLLRNVINHPEKRISELNIHYDKAKATPVIPVLGSKSQYEYEAPRNLWEFRLVQIWEKILKIKPIGIKENFFDLGGSSLLAVRMVGEIKKISGLSIPLYFFLEEPTIEKLARNLEEQQASIKEWPKVLGVQTKGKKPPFFCVSVASNGTGLEYSSMSRYLDPDQPVYTPYLGDVTNSNDMRKTAAECLIRIKSLQPAGPYYLGGWCYGGYIAYEVARQLEERGEKVAMLALLDTPGPEFYYDYQAFLLGRIVHFFKLPTHKKKDYFILVLRILWMRIKGVCRKIWHAYILRNTEQNSSQMYHIAWTPRPLNCRIEIFKAEEQTEGRQYSEHYGWSAAENKDMRTHVVPGDHVTYLREYYRELGKALDACLKEAQGK